MAFKRRLLTPVEAAAVRSLTRPLRSARGTLLLLEAHPACYDDVSYRELMRSRVPIVRRTFGALVGSFTDTARARCPGLRFEPGYMLPASLAGVHPGTTHIGLKLLRRCDVLRKAAADNIPDPPAGERYSGSEGRAKRARGV